MTKTFILYLKQLLIILAQQNLMIQRVINLIIKLTESIENLDCLRQNFVNLIIKELNVNYCLIQSFNDKKYISNLSEVSEVYHLFFTIANLIIEQEKNYLTQGQYLIRSSASYTSKFNLDFPIFTILIFPLKYKNCYLGNLFLYQESNSYQWEKSEIETIKLIAIHLAIALYQDQLEIENFYLKQEENLSLKTSYISHELRTPISAIVGFSQMLLKEIYGSLNSKQKDYVTRIFNSGEYLLSLVNDLLELFKVNQQKEELILTNINIKYLCEQVIMMIEEQAKIKNLDLLLLINTEIQTIIADEIRLKQILINLLSNSVKFTEKGSITLKVMTENSQIIFSVIDTGIGIKKEEESQLFKPFQRLSNNVNQCLKFNQKGTGLGLALSQQLAYLHHGKITYNCEVNGGSCFSLYLPINRD